MTKESRDENEATHALEAQGMSGHPDKRPLGVKNELPAGMSRPEASGESAMGGVHKGMSPGGNDKHLGSSDLGSAVRQLNYETERGEHAPDVAGHRSAGAQHQGLLVKD